MTDTTITAPPATITTLVENTEYDVQVRAKNDEGTSGWSGSGNGTTDANVAPVFTSAAAFDAAENQTAVGTVQASDGDGADSVTGYAIDGRRGRLKFMIGTATGVWRSMRRRTSRTRRTRTVTTPTGDERRGCAGEDGGADDHGDGDGRGRRGCRRCRRWCRPGRRA